MSGNGYFGLEMKKGETDRDLLVEFEKYCDDGELSFGVSEIVRFRDLKFGMFWWHGSRSEVMKTLHGISTGTDRIIIIGNKHVYSPDQHLRLYQDGKHVETLNPHDVVTIYTAI